MTKRRDLRAAQVQAAVFPVLEVMESPIEELLRPMAAYFQAFNAPLTADAALAGAMGSGEACRSTPNFSRSGSPAGTVKGSEGTSFTPGGGPVG